MFNTRFIQLIVIAVLALSGAPRAWAVTCFNEFGSGNLAPAPFTSNIPGFTITPNVNNNPNAWPVLLSTQTVNAVSPQGVWPVFSCLPAQLSAWKYDSDLPSITYKGVRYYDTGIPGIGLRINGGSVDVPYTGHMSMLYDSFNTTGSRVWIFTFYQIGTITGQGAMTGELAYLALLTPADNAWHKGVVFGSGGPIIIQPKIPTCAATIPNIPVPMPSTNAAAFAGAGSAPTGLAATNFSIGLICNDGDPSTSTNMYITLTDNTNPGNTSDQLSLTADSTATGVQLQLFQPNGNAVSYGPDSVAMGNTNQWFVKALVTGSTGAMNIPMKAQYVATGAPISGGTVNAIATFTLSYQ